MDKKVYQIELWTECNNNCTFCFLGDKKYNTSSEDKLKVLNKVIDLVKSDKLLGYNVLSFIGGEFFQGQLRDKEVKEKFFELFHLVKEKCVEKKISEVWVTAVLTSENQQDLYSTLDILKDCNVWVCTSYDIIGRFHTPKMLENWEYHMKKIHDEYPNVKLNTTMILTQALINAYNNGEIEFDNFISEYNTNIFFNNPECKIRIFNNIPYKDRKKELEMKLPGFFPKRNDFLSFIQNVCILYPGLVDKLFNIQYRADTVDAEIFGDEIISTRDKSNNLEYLSKNVYKSKICNHLEYYQGYVDSDECMMCDKENLLSLMSE